jgi:hypothetical protein
MLIVEDFLLIMLDPQSGLPLRANRDTQRTGAAALLLDLAEQRRLHVCDTGFQADASLPVTHPLLDQATQVLDTQAMSAPEALNILARKLSRIPERVLDGMVRRDILHRVGRRRWFGLRRWCYPLRSMQARNEALERLCHAAKGTDTRGLALLLLLDTDGLLPLLLNTQEQASARQRLERLRGSDRQSQVGETLRIIASVQRALLE